MQARLKSWRHSIWQRKGWFLFLLVYKIIEDWGLGKLIGTIEEQKGIWVSVLDFAINNLPWITWIAIPITILVLIVKTWSDSAKFQPVSMVNTNCPRLIHDGVLWEDNGNNMWGNLDVTGPLCPKDYTPLAKKRGDKLDTYLSNDTLISDSGYHSQLVCPECGGEYTLGSTPKMVRDSRGEVGSRFEGMRRRNQDG